MDKNFLQLIKENLLKRKQNILEFLKQTEPATIRVRTGPPGTKALGEHLHELDTTLEKVIAGTIGLCEICHEDVEVNRLEMDYTACVCLEHLTGDERTRLENDLELSQKVQRALLPHTLPDIRHVDLAAFSQPAHIVGGDYFDFLRFKDDSHAIVIADVMGKGMAASMLMSNLQASLRIIIGESTEPCEVVERLNQIFCRNIRLTKFVTLFLARYNEDTRVLTYCNAGHNPPFLMYHDTVLEQLRPTGAAIGLVDQSTFEQKDILLQSGNRLFLFTDGVVESANEQRELFGEDRLKELLQGSIHVSPTALIASVREALQNFSHSKSPIDDTTMIVIDAEE